MFSFEYAWVLCGLVFLPLFAIRGRKVGIYTKFSKDVLEQIYVKSGGFSAKFRQILLILSMAMIIISLSRPVIKGTDITVKSSFINVIIGLDISKSMSVEDLFPNRFEFAKNKLFSFLDVATDKRVSIVGFSDRAFLVSPLTNDFESVKFLVKNMSFSHLNLKGTSIMALLESANSLFDKDSKKVVLVFSDGGDKSEFYKEIAYAKAHNITVYIYLSASDKGGLFKSENGDMVVLKANENIKTLALETGGEFLNYSLNNNDIKSLNSAISSKFKDKKEESLNIKDQKELFYYFLALAVLFYFMAMFSLPDYSFKKDKM